LQCAIERETALVLGSALQSQLELLRSRGFVPVRVHMDPQSAFRTLTTKFKKMVIDTGGVGDYVPKGDVQIKRIKQIVRGVKATLPWKLPPGLLKDLVVFAVSRINIRRSTENVCARVAFTGLKPDFQKELRWASVTTVKYRMVLTTAPKAGVSHALLYTLLRCDQLLGL